jgi:uncharacterized protein
MTRHLTKIAALAFLFGLTLIPHGLPRPAGAQNEPTMRTISVSGEAQINVVPDQIILTLGVETSDKDLKVAKTKNDEQVSQILNLAKTFNVPPEKVKTDYISIQPRYNDSYQQREFLGFFVRKNIVFTLSDLSKFEELLSACLNSGANYVNGVDFRTTELRKHRDQARDLAVRAAKEKAEAMAGALGMKIGKPITISEASFGGGYFGGWGNPNANISQNAIQTGGSGAEIGEGDTVAPGQIAVSARISIVFELVE